MKKLKRLSAILLTLIMMLAMTTTAFAADQNVANATKPHTYDMYQIFKGTQAEGDAVLGDVEWGDNINSAAFLNALKANNTFVESDANMFADAATAADVAAVLGDENFTASMARAFGDQAANHLTGAAKATVTADTTTVNVPAGYYLLVDTTNVAGQHDAKNVSLLQVTNSGNIEIQKKYEVPTVEKKIDEDNDFATNDLVDSTDVNIGDIVSFVLTGTLPENYDDFEDYYYQFNDTLSEGLTFTQGSVKVYAVNNNVKTDITAQFDVSGAPAVIKCANLKAIPAETAAISKTTKIVVNYTATLNEKAVIGNPGNPNTVNLEFSNNPNQTGDGNKGKTPDDKVVVFTFELDTTKVDGANTETKLEGAEFKLYREADGQREYVKVSDGKVTGWTDKAASAEEAVGASTLTSDAQGLFKIAGLDVGTYFLEEIKAPAGYNKLTDPVKVVIAATYSQDEVPVIQTLTVKVADGENADGNTNTGVVSATVKNNRGSVLPETGGIGTTMFYILGTLFVIGAGVLLVARKRMSMFED